MENYKEQEAGKMRYHFEEIFRLQEELDRFLAGYNPIVTSSYSFESESQQSIQDRKDEIRKPKATTKRRFIPGGENDLSAYYLEANRYLLLSPGEERELAYQVRKGDKKAMERMITSNLRLVIHTAKKFQGVGLPLHNLIQEGNIGLIEAIKRYNPDLGYRFSTYASSYIKGYIKKALSNCDLVRVPANIKGIIPEWEEIEDNLRKESRYEPSPRQILNRFAKSAVNDGITRNISIIESAQKALSPHLSLDYENNGNTRLADILEDGGANPEEVAWKKENFTRVMEALDEREKEIVRMRFWEDMTLEEIGKRMNLSKERIRQLETRALRKLYEAAVELNG